ncbi:MAG: YihY/virulence factor BrkB family protein [Chloroflexota bacterium]|nr:YihY/virulence factor BrkB family protein [Chloroflexota bacterium]
MEVEKQTVLAVAKRMFQEFRAKDVSASAQLIAYNLLFALAPLLIFLTSFTSLIAQRVGLGNAMNDVTAWLQENLPADAATALEEPIRAALETSPGSLVSIGGLITLWSAKNAMAALMRGLNGVYGVKESRSWVRRQVISVELTVALAIAIVGAGSFYVLGTDVGDGIAEYIGLGTAWATVSTWLRWPVIAVLIVALVTLLHYFGPDLDAPLRWFVPGAAFTVVFWAIATVALRIYIGMSSGFSEAYGIFGAMLAVIFWLYVMSIIVLLGGLLNHIVQRRALGTERREAEVASKPPVVAGNGSGASPNGSAVAEVGDREAGGDRRGAAVEKGAQVVTAGVLAVGSRAFSFWRRRRAGR